MTPVPPMSSAPGDPPPEEVGLGWPNPPAALDVSRETPITSSGVGWPE
jgi:hypothetical protein